MSFHPTKALFGFCFVFIALVALLTGFDGDGDTVVWLWAAGFGAMSVAGFVAAIIGMVTRVRSVEP